MILPLFALAVGGSGLIALAAWAGLRDVGAEVWRAGWIVPPAVAVMLFQLWLSAAAWRISVGSGARPRLSRYFRIRWIREAVNSLLPVAQLGGNILGVRLLAHRGVPGTTAAAGTTLDITIEVATQFVFTVAGVAALALIGPRHAAQWIAGLLGAMALAVGGFILVQRAGLLRLVEALARPLGRIFPGLTVDAVRGLHGELMRLHRDVAGLVQAGLLHLGAWLAGAAETWLALWAMGLQQGIVVAFVIESLGMAARSAGFAVPGALGVQEGGFVVVAGLCGVPADAAIALSMLKRLREVAVGVAGLAMWQWAEGRRMLRHR
jgi:putative membrane protein